MSVGRDEDRGSEVTAGESWVMASVILRKQTSTVNGSSLFSFFFFDKGMTPLSFQVPLHEARVDLSLRSFVEILNQTRVGRSRP